MLESYITPLLMGYVNKYIKNLKPSDLSLSVWGGDVVLQNLELNLEVLQEELSLPVRFLSGRIHELQIHVPWTRITYEPVEITINTIEFVVKLRDPDDDKIPKQNDEAEKVKVKMFRREMQKAKAAREAEHLPPGYVQGVMNKVINNISLRVNNLILKYVEDDIVFSLNVKSVSLFSANENWEKAFVELKLPSLCLRKICNINDLTICLDSRNADGKIEMYQDPILYKCNLSCRILSKYVGLGSVSAYENQANVYCENLDLSSTDVQLPMIIRLLKLCLGLYYRTLDLPGCNYKHHPAEEILEHQSHLKNATKGANNDQSQQQGAVEDSGWVSWAWSMLPNLADEGQIGQPHMHYDFDTTVIFGIFITQCSLTLKVTDEAHNSSIVGTRRFEFCPVLNIEMSGCAIEVLSKGEEYFDCQFGVCNIVGYMIGNCLCKKGKTDIYNVRSDASIDFEEMDKEEEDELFFQIGNAKDTATSGVSFLEDSLFQQAGNHGNLEMDKSNMYKKTVLPEKGKQFNEGKVTRKFGALFFDYFYVMELPKYENLDEKHNITRLDPDHGVDHVKEVSTKRIIVGPSHCYLSSRLHHLVKKLIAFCEDDSPPRKMKENEFIDQFVVNQLMLGNLPTRAFHFTCQSLNLSVSYADHLFHAESVNEQCNLYGLMLLIDRVDYQVTSPMYPVELNFLLKTATKQKAIFCRAAYSDFFAKLFGVQVGICEHGPEGSDPTVLNIVPPTHATLYSKMFIGKSPMQNASKLEVRAQTPNLTFNLTKAQVLMITDLLNSWTKQGPAAFNQILLDDIFHPKAENQSASSLLDASLVAMEMKIVDTDAAYAVSGSLGSFKVSVQSLHKGVPTNTAVMYGPLNTAGVSSVQLFLDQNNKSLQDIPNVTLLQFKAQIPSNENQGSTKKDAAIFMLQMKGIALLVTQSLLDWADYKPSSIPRKRTRGIEKRPSRIMSRSMSASTPKKKSYTRLFGNSPSKTSKELLDQRDKKQEERRQHQDIKANKESLISYFMEIMKLLVLKVDLESIAVFMPVGSSKHVSNVDSLLSESHFSKGYETTNPDYNIPLALKAACQSRPRSFLDTLVVTLPSIKINSSNTKDVDMSCDIPILQQSDELQENSLPWALNGHGFSVYILTAETLASRPDFEACYMWHPAPWTMFLAAAHTNPKTPEGLKKPFLFLQDSLTMVGIKPVAKSPRANHGSIKDKNQQSLGFCVHIDLSSVSIRISRKQLSVILSLLPRFKKVIENLSSKKTNEDPGKRIVSDDVINDETKSNRSAGKDLDRRSVSTASTADQPDVLSVSTETSISGLCLKESQDDLVVSLWLQWIVPRMSVTLYGEPSHVTKKSCYKIPLQLEDLSFAFDYQMNEIQITSKVGSVSAKSYFLRQGGSEWLPDEFGGILFSCKDIISQNLDIQPSGRKSSLGSFLTVTYTRKPLSDERVSTRHDSVRSEAAILPNAQDLDEKSHASDRSPRYTICDGAAVLQSFHVTMQAFDVLLVTDPVVNIAESFLALNNITGKDTALKPAKLIASKEDQTREGTFQPLPQLDVDCKGIRVLVPLRDSMLHPEASERKSSHQNENVFIFQVRSGVIKPDPVNRISSTVLHKEWYRTLRRHQREKGRRTKAWHIQYKVDFNGISAWTGNWNDLAKSLETPETELSVNADGQNPALEWNYKMITERPPAKLSPILQEFDCRSVISPAIQVAKKRTNEIINICTTAMEINFPKEIIAHCNPQQVKLMVNVSEQTSLSLRNLETNRARMDSVSKFETCKSPDVLDSGISSDQSIKGISTSRSTQDAASPMVAKTWNDETGTPLELFLSISKVSMSLHVARYGSDPASLEGGESFRPICYLELVQPTLSVAYFSVKNSLELNVFDVLVAIAREDKTTEALPERSIFDSVVLSTSKGKRNQKTGLYPSAIMLTVTKNKSSDLKLIIDRPLQFDIFFEMTDVLDMFLRELELTQKSSPTPEPDTEFAQKTKRIITHQPITIAMLSAQTNRILVFLSTHAECQLATGVRSLYAVCDVTNSPGNRSGCSFKFDFECFEVNLLHHHRLCPLLLPCIFHVEGEAEFNNRGKRNEQNSNGTSRTILSFKSGLVRFQVSQLHLEYIQQLVSSFEENAKSSKDSQQSVIELSNENLKQSYVDISQDDLRTGNFKYVTYAGQEQTRPSCNQIMFSEEDTERPPTMTWRYPEPRFLKEVTIYPLPFHVDEIMHGDDLAEIPCVIRYWDQLEQDFVTYRHFFLSQNKSEILSFPDPVLSTPEVNNVASEEWQIVVDVAIESETEERSEGDVIPDDILKEVNAVYKTPVSAASLAACVKVDSCYLPEKIPHLLFAASIGVLQITFSNHFDTNESAPSQIFSPFFMDSYTYPSNQEACRLEFTNFLLKSSCTAGMNASRQMDLEFDASLDVMNYHDLSWRRCLNLSASVIEMAIESDCQDSSASVDLIKSKFDFEVKAAKIFASQFVVHTLALTAENWSTKEKGCIVPLLNHYVICNETEDVLRFGQVDTDEDIVLASGQMYPYSWRSRGVQTIHVCIDSVGDWKWSAPFDIDSMRGCSRTIKHSTHTSVILIEVKNLGGVQKQVIFRGGMVFRNCLKRDVEFELILHHVEVVGRLKQQKISQTPKNFIVPAETTRPSMSFSSNIVTSLYVKLAGDQSSANWSTPLTLSLGDKDDLCVPLMLTCKDELINVWYFVARTTSDHYSQLVVCICPMFIVRNHLCWPVEMKAKSRDNKETFQLQSLGRGAETEVFQLSSNTWYNVSFQLEGTSERTDPPIPINTTFVEILQKKKKVDLSVDFRAEWPYGDKCGIIEEQPPRILPQRSPTPLPDAVGPDLQCQLLQRWPTLPSIIVDIRPKFILINNSLENLSVRDAETHLVWEFAKDAALTSPAIQKTIQFGKVVVGESAAYSFWSSPIHLLEKLGERLMPESLQKMDELPLYTSSSFSIFNPDGNQCSQFAISSKIRNNMIIISFTDRFCIHNFTGLELNCFPCLCEGDNPKIATESIVKVHATEAPVQISKISLIQKSDRIEEMGSLDLSKFSILYFFQHCGSSTPFTLSSENVFDLSRDHLRENITIRSPENSLICLALTSFLKDGTINIYIDQEVCPSFVFTNHSGTKLSVSTSLSEKKHETKRSQVQPEFEWGPFVDVVPMDSFSHQCKSFRDRFPKIEALTEGRLKVVSHESNCSEEFLLDGPDGNFELTVGSPKILVSYQLSANCFHVLFRYDTEECIPITNPLNIPVIRANFRNLYVIVIDDLACEEVFDLSIDNFMLQHSIKTRDSVIDGLQESTLIVELGGIQLDNQSTDDYDHFPVVLLPLREVSQRYRGESPHNAPFSDTHASITKPLFRTVITAHRSASAKIFIDDLTFHSEPLEIYTEDSFIYRLVGLIDSFSPPHKSDEVTNEKLGKLISIGRQILNPINLGAIEINDVRILLSVHASVKMYLAADHMPIVLGNFKCHPGRTLQKELVRRILYHYATQALVRAGLMLGSLEIIANPTGLLRSLGRGISDFFALPYDGLTRGPSAFVSGIGNGTRSFFRHTSVGALTSITNFASSLSRNMDRLSFDEEHLMRQEERRCRTSLQVWPGFSNALSGFGISLLGAVAGLVDHSINNIQKADTAKDAFKGAAKGLGKGLVGMFAKPIGGAMELLSQTGQGILLGTGLTKPPKKLRAMLENEEVRSLNKDSHLMYSWKVLRVEFEEYSSLFVITDVHVSSESDRRGYHGTVLLTPSALYLYDQELSDIRMAFACNEIDLRLDQDTPHLICIEKRDIQKSASYCYSNLTDVDGRTKENSNDSSKDSPNPRSSPTSFNFPFLIQMNPRYASLILSQFQYQKDLIEEKMSSELEVLDISAFNT